MIPQDVTSNDQKYSVLYLLKVASALRSTRAAMYMEIVSIEIRTDVTAVSAGSGPSEMSLSSLETSIIVLIETFFMKL